MYNMKNTKMINSINRKKQKANKSDGYGFTFAVSKLVCLQD